MQNLQHNYTKMIVEMLNKIDSPNQLKKVFDYTCFVYLKCPVVEKVNE